MKARRAKRPSPRVRLGTATRALSQSWRFWAALPAGVLAVDFVSGRKLDGLAVVVATVSRPTFPHGVCRTCGCTERDACLTKRGPCAWANYEQTLCTGCK